MQKTRDPEARQQLQTRLARVEQQLKEEQTRRQQQTALKSHKVGNLTELDFTLHLKVGLLCNSVATYNSPDPVDA